MVAVSAALRTPEAVAAQQPAAAEVSDDPGALPLAAAEEVATAHSHFFTASEMALFRRLADLLAPRTRTPGALDAGAPEFLDFYLSQSGTARQRLYREGLARLAAAGDLQTMLAPLRQPWTPQAPADPLAAFLRAAKEDLLRATFSSRAWALATEARRRSTGATYWYPVE